MVGGVFVGRCCRWLVGCGFVVGVGSCGLLLVFVLVVAVVGCWVGWWVVGAGVVVVVVGLLVFLLVGWLLCWLVGWSGWSVSWCDVGWWVGRWVVGVLVVVVGLLPQLFVIQRSRRRGSRKKRLISSAMLCQNCGRRSTRHKHTMPGR